MKSGTRKRKPLSRNSDPRVKLSLSLQTLAPAWKKAWPGARGEILRLAKAALKASELSEYQRGIAISVVLSDDDAMRELNHTFRGKNKPTNVLSFPAYDDLSEMESAPDDEPFHLGDVVLSYDTVRAESLEQKKSFRDHASHLIVHGCLHLAGYDHEDDREADAMEAMEIQVLSQFGIRNPYRTRSKSA